MTDSPSYPFVLALAQPTAGQPNPWVSMIPFALMILIFYVLVLLPMRKRQKKVEAFQAGLKEGDKVVTTSGIYGHITKVTEKTVVIQIADKVRIEVARAAVGGYQNQEPVVEQNAGRM